jgi:hypothetical protein
MLRWNLGSLTPFKFDDCRSTIPAFPDYRRVTGSPIRSIEPRMRDELLNEM